MNLFRTLLCLLCALVPGATRCALAQDSLYQSFRSHNAEMTKLQPSWVAPLIQSDARLGQGVRLSVANMNWPGGQTISYGNNHGISLLARRRFQFDFNPPAYFRNHSAQLKDGFGNASTQVKMRLASGNAEHGNYIVSAALMRCFSPRAEQNGGLTGAWLPKVVAGKEWGRFVALSSLNGVLPTGKTSAQGRVIEWSATGEARTTAHLWLTIEDNAAWFRGSPIDGKMQNFLTPQAEYLVRSRKWAPSHAFYVFACGMQIATSSYHQYNHNLVAEARVLF
ncbi:MAG: hypothetical protein WCE75_09260 [Terracidiphilus sp.]